MATTFKVKRFSSRAEQMKKVAEDAYYKELGPKGEKLGKAIGRHSRNIGRFLEHNKKPIGIAGGTILAGTAAIGGYKGYKDSKKKQAQKTYSVRRRLFTDGEQQKKGMGWGTKALIGAGTLAGGIAAAKTGMLGKTAKLGVNKAQFGLGKAVGSKGLMKNAVQGQREALGKVKVPKTPVNTQKALPAPAPAKQPLMLENNPSPRV